MLIDIPVCGSSRMRDEQTKKKEFKLKRYRSEELKNERTKERKKERKVIRIANCWNKKN